MNLPESFTTRMKNMLKDDYDNYIESFNNNCYQGIRINTSKISVEDFLSISPFNLKPVPWTNNGFYYESNIQPAKHPYYFAGLYYIQEPSAMSSASFMPIDEGDRVLDICAAPGGKSTELAAKLNQSGLLVSNDISNSRAKALLKNLEMFGISNSIIVSEPPNELAKRFPHYFDKILIDAPCSGEGMFRKQNSMIKAWENNGVDLFVGLQRGILKEVVKMLRPGGTIVYSTCTFSPEENEQSMEYLMSLDENIKLVPLPVIEGFDIGHKEWGNTDNDLLSNARRIWPHRVNGEGHFVAMSKHNGSNDLGDETSLYFIKSGKLSDEFIEFLKLIDIDFDLSRMEVDKDRIFYLPQNMPDVRGLRLLRTGLYMGDMKKNRFEPSQSLAMFLKGNEFKNTINLTANDDRTIRYLKGETIEASGNDGYNLVLVDGYPLGFGKLNKGVLKNKYLPSWRWL